MHARLLIHATGISSLVVLGCLLTTTFCVVAADSADRLDQYCDQIERSFGSSPAEAVRNLGEPLATSVTPLVAEDFGEPVLRTELSYPDGTLVFDRINNQDRLSSADFQGGDSGFADIAFGDEADQVSSLLGEPHAVRNWVWTYHAGMRRIHVGFDRDGRVHRLMYEQDAF